MHDIKTETQKEDKLWRKESKFEEERWKKRVDSRPEFAGPQEETRRGCGKNYLDCDSFKKRS